MKLFFAYLKSKRATLAACALFALIFALSFALFHLPLKAVLYPTFLCLFLGLCMLALDFGRVRRAHAVLQRVQDALTLTPESLPAPQGVVCADAYAVIARLASEARALQARQQARLDDTIEYYTAWAHQIKTPIAAMRLVLQNDDSALSRRCTLELLRIEQYADMVLAFLRLDSTSSDYVFRRCALDPIIRASARRFAPEFIDRHLYLEYEPIRQSALTDSKWLGFVIDQLLSNALKYTPSGGIRIFAEGECTLCIADTGIGIAPEDLPRVFEKGYTGLNGRANRSASGLGLYLCKRICASLGAQISIASTPGAGTAVRIDLSHRPPNVEAAHQRLESTNLTLL